MSYITADRVKETTTIVGTGTVSLLGTSTGFRTFASQMTVGDTCSYIISNASGSEWESGIATYSAANTLTRTSVKSSSNSNNAVVFTAGVKDVFIGVTADSVVDKNNARLNTINAIPVASGVGNNITLTAGSGVGTGAGGSIILQPGAQATSGGDGKIIVKGLSGSTQNLQEWQDSSGTVLSYINLYGGLRAGLNGTGPSYGIVIGDATNNFTLHRDLSNYTLFNSTMNGWLRFAHTSSAGISSNTSALSIQLYNTSILNSYTTQDSMRILAPTFNGSSVTLTNANTFVIVGAPVGSGVTITNPAALKVNTGYATAKGIIVQGASSQTANLQEWQDSSSTTKLAVQPDGTLLVKNGLAHSGDFSIRLVDVANTGIVIQGDRFNFITGGSTPFQVVTSRLSINVPIVSGSNALELRNSTTAQAFRVYNTYTDGNIYERLGITWASNICTIGVERAGGGGVQRVLNVNANNINAPTLPTAATVTAATGNGTTVTYTSANTFSVGQIVSITGLTTTTGSSLNLSNQTITTASATQFTVTNATVGTAAATQSGTATIQSAGNSVTITAGNGSGVGAGGNIILQPGAQGTSGGNGSVSIGTSTTFKWSNTDYITNIDGSGFVFTSGNAARLGLSYYSGYYQVSIPGTLSILPNGSTINLGSAYVTYQTLEYGSFGTIKVSQGRFGGYGIGTGFSFPSYTQNIGSSLAITNKSLTGNVATLTTSTPHKLIYGQVVAISGVDATFDGTYTVTNPQQVSSYASLTTFSYTKTAADVASQAATGTATVVLNDINLGPSPFVRINTQTAQTITGLIAPFGYGAVNAGVHLDGRMIRIYNVGTANLTLSHNSASSTAANRMFSSTGADIVIAPNQYVEAIYDSTNNGSGAAGWRISSVH